MGTLRTDEAASRTTATGSAGRGIERVVRMVEAAVLVVLIAPTNEIIRVALVGVALAVSRDAYLAALTWGASTLVIETISALVTSDLLDSAGGRRWTDWFNTKAARIGITPTTRLSTITKAGISFIAGSGVAVFVRHREDPTRTRRDNMGYGVRNALMLAAVCTVQGYLVAAGIADPGPFTIGGAVLATAGVIAIGKWVGARVRAGSGVPETAGPDSVGRESVGPAAGL